MKATRRPHIQEFLSQRKGTEKMSWLVRQRRGVDEVFYGSEQHHPQYAALHRSSYLRLVCSGSTWGTSIILMPSFWANERYWQGSPIKVEWNLVGEDLIGCFTGKMADLRVRGQVRLLPPEPTLTTAIVTVTLEGNTAFDERNDEAFKPVMLSSMNISPQEWDCYQASVESESFNIPKAEWIIRPAIKGQTFGLHGGTSPKWKANAPTVQIFLDREMQISGWVTPSQNHNDDNVGFWAASDFPIHCWEYRVLVRLESN